MAQLAIKGYKTRGAEVINLLEMLGGRNLRKLAGTDPDSCYIINNNETISGIINVCLNNKYVRYTIEEFLEKFPYKVGDKVQYKGSTCLLEDSRRLGTRLDK